MDGNSAYAKKADKKLLASLVKDGQHPLVMVLSCSDSRVPVELIFDAKQPGSIFVARNAGNLATYDVVGSAEYAAEHLGITKLVVLGHTNCGAVKGAMAGNHAHGALGKVLAHIEPAVEKSGGDMLRAIELNVKNQIIELMHQSEVIKKASDTGKLEIVGMIYELETGKVRRI
jgi:carbonic anhydrase